MTDVDFSRITAGEALRSGDFQRLEKLARAALQRAPQDPAWWQFLGAALALSGRVRESKPVLRQLAEMQPNQPGHWCNLGNACFELGELEEAEDALKRALSLDGRMPLVQLAMAKVLRSKGLGERALHHADLAIQAMPRDAEARLVRAALHLWRDDWDRANSDLRLVPHNALPAPMRAELGELHLQMNQFSEAREALSSAISVDASNIQALLALALVEERENRLDAVRMLLDRVRQSLPGVAIHQLPGRLLQVEARLAFREGRFDDAARNLDALLAGSVGDPMQDSFICFELGAALDKAGEHDAAWQAFGRAHAMRRVHLDSLVGTASGPNDLQAIIESSYPPSWSDDVDVVADGKSDPIFVVGFPRSGTTLLEQILDAQPELASFDEQPFLQRLILEMKERGFSFSHDLGRVRGQMALELREKYFSMVAGVVPDLGARRPVDKNPLNTVRIPLAQRLFPRAKVILAIRHPCDVVLSCFMQSFRTPVLGRAFSSLEGAAELYDKVMCKWRECHSTLDLPVLVNRYEDLVVDPYQQTRVLAEFVALEWSERWVDPSGHVSEKQAIRTPSYAQVAEPIHARASGRWMRYRKYFDSKTLRILEPWIDAYGYEFP